MHVMQLFHSLLRAPDVEIIKARLPECSLGFSAKKSALPRISPFSFGQERVRRALLENLHDSRWTADLRFCNQKMNMFGHHDVSDDYESVLLPRLFEDRKKAGACARRIKERQAVIARVSESAVAAHRTFDAGRKA